MQTGAMCRQQGQAAIETAISLTFVIVPLLILLPLMAKVTNMQHRADQAAQYTAWERTVWHQQAPSKLSASGTPIRSDAQIAATVAPRFYGEQGRLVDSNTADWNWQTDIHPFLRFQSQRDGSNTPLLASFSGEANDASMEDRVVAGASGSSKLAIEPIARAFIDLENRHYFTSRVRTQMESIQIAPFDALELTVSGNAALLTAGWNAAGPQHVVRRIQDKPYTLPLANLDIPVLNTLRNTIGSLPYYRDIRTSRLKLGHVEPDVLPPSLLCTYGTTNCGG